MSPSSVASLFVFCLLLILLPAQHEAASYASYKVGSRQIFFKTPGKSSVNSQQVSTVLPATTCSSIATAGLGKNKLPILHRQSPCSPLHGLPSPTAADVLRRDASLIRRRFSSPSSSAAAALAPSPAATTIPTNTSTDDPTYPGALDYSVLVSYGTPEQQFPMLLGNSLGTSVLRCKPCGASGDCDPAFDTSRSSTFADILCGSPECPTNCSEGTVCPFEDGFSIEDVKSTLAKDVLTLAASTAVDDFRFACVEVDQPSPDEPEVGTLDLSRHRNSLPSQLSPLLSPETFSYCLPQSPSSQGFLSIGATARNNDPYNLTTHAPLVNSSYPELSNMYFIDLVNITLATEDLPIPASTFGGNASAAVDLGTTFTWLAPDAYTALSNGFRKGMSQYSNLFVPGGFAGFDTCYNFTRLDVLAVPGIELWFSNGEGWPIDGNQMFYFDDPAAAPFTMTCLAFLSLDAGGDVFSAIIGTYTLASNEVVYDVAGGTVNFIPGRCL